MKTVGCETRMATNKERNTKKVMRHMTVTPSENGGASVEHSFQNYEHSPEMHTFGPQDGKEFMEHMMEHTGIQYKPSSKPEAEDETGGNIAEKK